MTTMTSTAPAPRADDPEWSWGDRLRKARLRHGSTQREFADALEVKAPTYAAWEADRTHCPRETAIAKRIEVLTGIRAAWVLGLDDPSPVPPGPVPFLDSPETPGVAEREDRITHQYVEREQPAVVLRPQFRPSPAAVVASTTTAVRERKAS